MDSNHRGATLFIGAAGTGKTTELLRRNIELVRAGETGILFLLGDRRASRALQARILRDLGASTGEVRVSTWHAFALSILRLYHDKLGRAREPGLITGPEQYALVREMLAEEAERAHWARFPKQLALAGFVGELREFVGRAQDAMLLPEELADRAEGEGRPDLAEAARFFRRYLTRLDERNVVDANNAIALTALLIERDEDVAADVRAGTRHLLVDDFQDITVAQERLLRALLVPGGSVTVAADPDARVFGFRGSMPDAVERFRTGFRPVREVALTEVRRPVPARSAWLFDHLTEEADAVAREARRLHAREGLGWGEIAVIVRRYGAASRAIRRSFERAGVPYVLVGENRPLVNEPALRPMLDLARAALRPEQRDELLPGILASPVVSMDPYTVRALRRAARLAGRTIGEMLDDPPEDLPAEQREPLVDLKRLLARVAEVERNATRPDEVFWFLWDELPFFRAMVERADQEELDAVSAFGRAVERFGDRRPGTGFTDFLAAVEGVEFGPEPWRIPEQRRPDAVRIMTAHHAVGSEFPAVFVAGCVEGEFPDARAPGAMFDVDAVLRPVTPFERRVDRLAEERRLFGVAMSRATRTLVLTAARESSQRQALEPSPFVEAAGIDWAEPPAAVHALTRAEAEAAARRTLAAGAEGAVRDDALALLACLPGVDVDAWWYEREWTDPGTPLHADELKTSYSRLSVYENCPLQYLYQVEMGLDPDTSHAMLVGTWIHDIVDRCARGEIDKTVEALHAALDEIWDPSIFQGLAIEHRRKQDCYEMLAGWLGADGDLDTLASEVAFAFPVDGALVRGRIDRLVRLGGSSVRVIDYKTGRYAKSPEEIEEDLQLAIYNLAMHRTPELAALGTPRHVELAWLGTVWGNGNFIRRGLDPTRRQNYEAETEAKIAGFVEGIKAERFAPSPSADCMWCRFKTLCPVWAEGDEVPL